MGCFRWGGSTYADAEKTSNVMDAFRHSRLENVLAMNKPLSTIDYFKEDLNYSGNKLQKKRLSRKNGSNNQAIQVSGMSNR